MKERNLLLAVAALVIVIAAAFAFSSPRQTPLTRDGAATNTQVAERDSEPARPRRSGSQLCASSAGFQQLKTAAFEQAIQVRGDPASLQRLAATSVVRMENPVATSEEGSDFAACSGRLVIELPPGAERGAGGQRRLAADVEYTAQADGRGGIAYQLTGGDAIVSSLAAFDIERSLQAPDAAESAPVEVAQAPAPEDELPVIIRPDPADRPAPRPAPPAREKADEPAPRPAPARREPPVREPPIERRENRAPAPRAERPAPIPERVVRPSFSCSSARTRSERAICSSERLAAKDRAMSRLFFAAMEDADSRTRAELQRTRNRFLAYRERCGSEECIAGAYDGRMREIRDIMEGAAE